MSLDADHPARRSRRGRTLLACAAAGAIVLGAGGYGLAAALAADGHHASLATTPAGRFCPSPGTPSPSRPPSPGSISTFTICAFLDIGAGRLTRAAGQTLTLVSARGYTSTVTTSAATVFLRVETGNPGEITDGTWVRVTVAPSGSALTAATVMIHAELVVADTGPGANEIILGRVADASATSFTLVRSDGRRSQVIVVPSTIVITPVRISQSQLQLGVATIAAGGPGADGAVVASTVEQFAVPAAIPPLYTSG